MRLSLGLIARVAARTPRRAALVFFLLSSFAAAQIPPARITGQVLDPHGEGLPEATVTLRSGKTGLERSEKADKAGRFCFEDLAEGEYILSATRPGFSGAARSLRLESGEARILELRLEPAPIAEEVTVISTHIAGAPEAWKRTPGSVEVLDPETLQLSRLFTLSEALRKVSGLHIREEEGFGLRPNIGVRGLNPTRSSKVLLLEDGIPVAFAPYGDNASYYHPPIERFESIEVVKGSGQVAYGPATVGGVINYITPMPPAEPSGWVRLAAGSRGYFNGQISYGGTWGRTGLRLDYMRKQGNGARENVHSELDDFNLKLAAAISGKQTLTLRGNYYGEDSRNTYSGLTEEEYRANPRQNPFANDSFQGRRFGASATHTYRILEGATLTTNLYSSRFERDWWRQSSHSRERPNDSSDPKCGGMDNLHSSCGNEGRLRNYSLWGFEPRLRFTHRLAGVPGEAELGLRVHVEKQDRRQENGETPRARRGTLVEDNERKSDAFSAFLQNRFLLGNWTLTPGLRIEEIRYERTNRLARGGAGASGRADLTQLIPGLGVSYSLGERMTLFAGVHRGFAPPRTEDVVDNAGGSVDLDPELSWNWEIGLRSLFLEGLRLEATFFRIDYENQIVPSSLAGGVGAALTNGGETFHQGAEVTARLDTGTLFRSLSNVSLRLAYTYLPLAQFTGTRSSSVPGFRNVSVSGNRLPYAPEHLLNVSLGYSHPSGLEGLLEAVHVGGQFADDLKTRASEPDGQRGRIPGYTVWNATLGYRLEALQSELFLTVKNLFDRTFIVDRTRGILPGSPRLLQAGVKVRL